MRRVGRLVDGKFVDGILVGAEMCLDVSTQHKDADVTVRVTTKVIAVLQPALDMITDLVGPNSSELADSATDATERRVGRVPEEGQ